MADFSNTVVSVALLYAGTKEALPLEAVSSVLSARFPSYELPVIANPVEEVTPLERTLLGFPNTRRIVLNNTASGTVLREKALEQCIGDQPALFDPQEADPACIPAPHFAIARGVSRNDYITFFNYSVSMDENAFR